MVSCGRWNCFRWENEVPFERRGLSKNFIPCHWNRYGGYSRTQRRCILCDHAPTGGQLQSLDLSTIGENCCQLTGGFLSFLLIPPEPTVISGRKGVTWAMHHLLSPPVVVGYGRWTYFQWKNSCQVKGIGFPIISHIIRMDRNCGTEGDISDASYSILPMTLSVHGCGRHHLPMGTSPLKRTSSRRYVPSTSFAPGAQRRTIGTRACA